MKDTGEMKRHLKVYVKQQILPKDEIQPSSSNRPFFPKPSDIRSHVYHASIKNRFSKIVCEMLYTNTNKNVVVLLLNSDIFHHLIIRQVKTRGALTPLHFIVIKITSKDNSAVPNFTLTEFLTGMTMIEKSKSFYTTLCSCN